MSPYARNINTMRQKRLVLQKLFFSASFRTCLVVVVLVFSMLYIYNINNISTKGYKIQKLSSDIVSLQQENRQLNIEVASRSSMQSIENRLNSMNLVAVKHIDYLASVDGVVARR